MPELPEVEVTRLSFADRIAGATVLSVTLGKALRWPINCETQALHGQHISGVRRRGKYLLVDLSNGLLLIHLGMSGSISFAASLPAPGKHDHFEMQTTQGTLRLNDPRRFGAVNPLSTNHNFIVLANGLILFDSRAASSGMNRGASIKN